MHAHNIMIVIAIPFRTVRIVHACTQAKRSDGDYTILKNICNIIIIVLCIDKLPKSRQSIHGLYAYKSIANIKHTI